MKLERIKRRSGGTLVLEITPLIDVVFLLLIFFMLATSFDERSAFKIDLPKSTAAKTKSTLKEVQVLVDKKKNIYLRYTDNSGKSQSEKLDLSSFVSVVSEKLNTSESKRCSAKRIAESKRSSSQGKCGGPECNSYCYPKGSTGFTKSPGN